MMHGYGVDGWDWFWMAPMMVFWLLVLAVVIYAAVRLALRDDRDARPAPVAGSTDACDQEPTR